MRVFYTIKNEKNTSAMGISFITSTVAYSSEVDVVTRLEERDDLVLYEKR